VADKKHAQNQRKKKQALARRGAIEAPGGEMVMPTDPRWVKLASQQAEERKEREANYTWTRPKRQVAKPEALVVPDWLKQLQRKLAYASVVEPEQLVYKGHSTRTGTKAGKRKVLSHHFIITPPLPHPFEKEPTTMLWHGSPLHNAGGILSGGLRASFGGMLGAGVYLGDLTKARNYVHSSRWSHEGHAWGLLLYCEAALGKVLEAEPGTDVKGADTLHCASGSYGGAWSKRIKRQEWCVREPRRIVVREIHLVPRPSR